MKIKCVNCGKKFDTGKYSNICPACSTYNKTYDNWLGRELTPEEQAEYDAKYNREPMVHHQYERYSKDVIDVDFIAPVWLKHTEAYKKNSKVKYVWAGAILVIIIVLIIVTIVHE